MQEMRLAKRQITDYEELHAVVESCQVLHIGAVDNEGMFVVPINYGYIWDDTQGAPQLVFYVHSATEGRKARCFSAAGAQGVPVAIELDLDRGTISGSYACAYSRAYVSIMGSGRITPVTNSAEKVHGLSLLMEHAAPGAPVSFASEAIERTAVFRIEVKKFTGKERRPKTGALQ